MPAKVSRPLLMFIYFLIGVVCVLAIGVTKNCGRLPSEPVEGYSGGDTIDIALIYSPGSYYLYGDTVSGINSELARIFSEETDYPVKIWPVAEPAAALEKLAQGAFDVLASLPLDNNIRNRFNVSESIFLDRLVLLELEDSVTGLIPVSSSLDLDGREVSVAPGGSAMQRMENLADEIGGNVTVKEEDGMSDELLSLKVATGEIPLAVVNERVADNLMEKYPRLRFDSSISFTQFQVWVFNKNDSTTFQKFNGWFDKFRDTDTYRDIINKY